MTKAIQAVKQFLVAEDGPTAVEYAVMLALIIVACVGAVLALGSRVEQTFNEATGVIGGTDPAAGG